MNLNLMTVSDLRKLAAQFSIAGRSTMKKAELIRELSDPDIADLVELAITVDEIEETAVVDAATAEHENEEIDLTSTIDDMVSGWLPAEVTPIDADVIVPAGMFDPELTYFADGTQVVMRAQDTEQYGVTVGMTTDAGPYRFQAVRFADGTVKNVAPHVLHRNDAAEQADAEAGELLDAALGEHVEPVSSEGQIAITKYNTHEAIATADFGTDSIGAHVTKVRGRWVLQYGSGHVVRAKTLGKVAKLWARALGFHAMAIDIDAMN